MKVSILISAISIVLFRSCQNKAPKSESEKVYVKPDSIAFEEARDLKGLGYFNINESNYKKTLAELRKEFKKNSTSRYYPSKFYHLNFTAPLALLRLLWFPITQFYFPI